MKTQRGFVLTRQWRDTPTGVELEFWLATDGGAIKLLVPQQQAVCFIPAEQQPHTEGLLANNFRCEFRALPLKNFAMQPMVGCYFFSQRQQRQARDLLIQNGISPLEADIKPDDRFLMERFVRGGLQYQTEPLKVAADSYYPKLKMVSLDIETAMQGIALYSIGLYAEHNGESLRKVMMVGAQAVGDGIDIFPDEKQLLIAFLQWLEECDPDIVIGWNVVNFDFWFLQQVCKKYHLQFRCGRGQQTAHWRELDDEGERRAIHIPGRVVLDGIELLKAAHYYRFESYALNYVAEQLLGDSKLLTGSGRGEQIGELFATNKKALADYNLQDCKLVWDIFQRQQLLDFAIARTQMTGLPLDRIGGSVASFDFRYLPLLHRRGFVAPNGHLDREYENSPGGFVMNSKPGIYQHVAVLDFKSLYPSIIRSFKIDPLGMALGAVDDRQQSELVPGFKGAWFDREQAILPDLITELWQQRDKAKAANDAALSQAIKIIMNSFYGVLGSAGCRFFDSRLASSITRRGHQIIQQTADHIEQQGWPVIYGDTDSVFVWLKNVDSSEAAEDIGRQLQDRLNHWWQQRLEKDYGLKSFLELEFETLYLKFLMPTVRGSAEGSKKRYAGVVSSGQLVFKGLENVRTDWTPLAREFQHELYRRIFFDEPYTDFIKKTVAEVMAGERDHLLVYRKRLRRKLSEYQRNVPPHVQAARKHGGEQIRRGDWIDYVITVNGAEPVSAVSSTIDRQHYIDKQLAPVADSLLYFLNQSLAEITDQQLGLF